MADKTCTRCQKQFDGQGTICNVCKNKYNVSNTKYDTTNEYIKNGGK